MVNPRENGENTAEGSPILSAAVLIPNYDGSSTGISIAEFVRIVDDAAGLAGWNGEQTARIARIKVQGQADMFLQANPELITKEWPLLKKELQKRFHLSASLVDVRNSLRECVQGSAENATEFATRLRVIGDKLLSFADENASADENAIRQKVANEEILAQFIKGLKEGIRRFVSTHNPQNLDEAVQKATREESYL